MKQNTFTTTHLHSNYLIIICIFVNFYSSSFFGAHKPEIGIGVSDNANFSDSNPKRDSYLFIKNYSTSDILKKPLSFYLSYKQFQHETQNNTLLWNLKYTIPLENLLKDDGYLNLGIGGQDFTSKNPETSDEGFDNFFFDMSLMKTFSWDNSNELTLEPGFQARRYDDTNKRVDQKIFFNATADLSLNPKQLLTPTFEIGFISSTDSLYQKNYSDIGIEWLYKFSESLKLKCGLFYKQSWYPQRTLSKSFTLPSAKKNQKNTTVTQNEIENQNFTQFDIAITKEFKSTFIKAKLIKTNQLTRSHTEDYNEFNAQSSVGFYF